MAPLPRSSSTSPAGSQRAARSARFGDLSIFFFQAEDGIRDLTVTGVQTCALPIWPDRYRSRCDRNMLSRRGGDRCVAVWLWNRSIRSKEIVLHHGCGLSHWNGALGVLMEFCELRFLPRTDRGRNRRRVCGDQFRDRRADSSTGARSRRFDDQRLLWDWRGTWLRRDYHFARSQSVSDRVRLAICVCDWCDPRPHCDFLSPLDPGKSALADDSRTKC